MLDALHCLVIQRCRGSSGVVAVDSEGDVLVAKGRGASVAGFGSAVEVLGGAEKPVEADDDEVNDVSIERSVDFVVDVKGIQEALDDREVGWVGAGCRVVILGEFVEESSEYWIVPFVSRILLSGIASTHVGDPLAHRVERRCDCITSDSVVGAVSDGVDEHVAEPVLAIRDIREVRGVPVLGGEGGPLSEDGHVGLACSATVGQGGALQSSAEIRGVLCLDGR